MADAIASLIFDIGADTAKLQEGLKKSQAIVRSFGSSTANIGDRIGASFTASLSRIGGAMAGAFAVEKIVEFTAESVRSAAELGRFADQAGMSVKQFEGLSFALRDAQVPQEQLAASFAILSRNVSDLQRGTGPLLDFLRRYAPSLEASFKATNGTSQAFRVLVDAVNSLTNPMDRVRFLQVALGEQGAKLNNSIRQTSASIDQQAASFQGVGESGVKAAQDVMRRWNEVWDSIKVGTAKAALATIDGIFKDLGTGGDPQRLAGIATSIATINDQLSKLTAPASTKQIEVQTAALRAYQLAWADATRNTAHLDFPAPPPAAGAASDALSKVDLIKKAQADLQLLQSQLQAMPPAAFQMSGAFAAAFGQMASVIKQTTSAEEQGALIGAAANNMRVQAYQAYVTAMGAALPLEDQHQQRLALINLAIADQAAKQQAVNMANFEYQQQQLQALAGLGVQLTANGQIAQSLERIRIQTDEGRKDALLWQRAMQAASTAASLEFVDGLATITGALASAFPAQKAFAIANATMNLAVAISKALALEGPLGWAEVAKITAAGVSLMGSIMSASMSGGGGSVPSVGGGAAPAAAPAAPAQMLSINLAPGRYSRDDIAMLIDQINEANSDGKKLVVQQ